MNRGEENFGFGELSEEVFDFKHLSWKIPNVLSLPNMVGFMVQSNIFSFAGATWRLRMYPFGRDYDSKGSMDILIVRLKYQIPVQNVFSKICFQTCNGKEFESISGWDVFDSTEHENGVCGFIEKSKFKQKKNLLLMNGALTVLCELRTKKIDGIDEYSQVEPDAPFFELPVKKLEGDPGSSSSTITTTTISEDCHCISQPPVTNQGNKTLQDLKELFLKQELCDVTINVKGWEFQAHKVILIARSPVFASTFRNEMKEKATGIIDIEDCDPSSFSDFLCFLYSGNVESISSENVFSLFTIADKYDVQDLKSECLEFIQKNLSLSTFCDAITLALKHSEKELLKATTDFFATHMQEIIVTVKWQSFLIKNPIQGNEIMIKALASNKK